MKVVCDSFVCILLVEPKVCLYYLDIPGCIFIYDCRKLPFLFLYMHIFFNSFLFWLPTSLTLFFNGTRSVTSTVSILLLTLRTSGIRGDFV